MILYLKLFNVIAVAIFISVRAKRLPMHMRGPAVNGRVYNLYEGFFNKQKLVTSKWSKGDWIKVFIDESLWLKLLWLGKEILVLVAGSDRGPHLHVLLDEQSRGNLHHDYKV